MSAQVLVIARYSFASDPTEDDLADLAALAAASAAEPGVVSYEVLVAPRDPRRVILLERYSDEAALRAHRDSEHFRQIALERIIPRLDSRVVEQRNRTPWT